ncbi:hypothetical protein G7054_g10823 [Neopestalotiopsis clavispora]|nr:hypothetical protein G7054_g10823 [Neopestalotiopsis clavispora]
MIAKSFSFGNSGYHPHRQQDADAPLAIWMQGGPGGTSLAGMLLENGPCKFDAETNSTTYNEHSWTEEFHMLYLDQPVPAGFSYMDNENTNQTLPARAEQSAIDFVLATSLIYELLGGLYISPSAPLHLTGESYAGRWLPVYAAAILDFNEQATESNTIPLRSIMVGNGYTSPIDLYRSYYEVGCSKVDGIAAILNDTQCAKMEASVDRCEVLLRACSDTTEDLICIAATDFCSDALIEPARSGLYNVYDRTMKCKAPGQCYPAFDNMIDWMNSNEVKKALEIKGQTGMSLNFTLENMGVFGRYFQSGDWAMSSIPHLEQILQSNSVDVLYYTGMNDFMCNRVGVYRGIVRANWPGHTRFRATPPQPLSWRLESGKIAGTIKKYSRLAVVELVDGGHVCDETRPECGGCIKRGVQCSGYERPLHFKDVSEHAAESSKKFEAARWSAINRKESLRKRKANDEPTTQAVASKAPGTPGPGTESSLTVATDPDESEHRGESIPLSSTASSVDGRIPTSCAQRAAFTNVSVGDRLLDDSASSPTSGNMIQNGVSLPLSSPVATENDFVATNMGTQHEAEDNDGTSTTSYADESINECDDLRSFTANEINLIDTVLARNPEVGSHIRDMAIPSSDSSMLWGMNPMITGGISVPHEHNVIRHFIEFVAPSLPVSLPVSAMSRDSSCFRQAVLALSEGDWNMRVLSSRQGQVNNSGLGEKGLSAAYTSAVRALNHKLSDSKSDEDEHLAATALLLAYHELRLGSFRGLYNHASGLNAIASKIDFTVSSIPSLFKAWRFLRYDLRLMSLPTRHSSISTDDYDIYSLFDPQLAVRDIFSSLKSLYGRFVIEFAFAARDGVSQLTASQRANRWLYSVFSRRCDQQQYEQRDFHETDLDAEHVRKRCVTYSRRLDQWYASLRGCDHPVAQLADEQSFLMSSLGHPITTYKTKDSTTAISYVMYLLSRMICSFLLSRVDSVGSPMIADAWAQILIGIVADMDTQSQSFTPMHADMFSVFTVFLCADLSYANIVLYDIVPRMLRKYVAGPEHDRWKYVKAIIELIIRERLRGRDIRYIMDAAGSDHKFWPLNPKRNIAAFGDYHGSGSFRGVYTLHIDEAIGVGLP